MKIELRVSKLAKKALKKNNGKNWGNVAQTIADRIISASGSNIGVKRNDGSVFCTEGKIEVESCEPLYHFTTGKTMTLSQQPAKKIEGDIIKL